MNILIADSGSTKTHWCLLSEGQEKVRIRTQGINPFYQSLEEIEQELQLSLLPQLPQDTLVNEVHFFGAGCTPEKSPILVEALRKSLHLTNESEVEVGSDMIGAARALCGRQPGIACILGTGSNSCYYDGEKVVSNVPPLGFILGDEGSGAVLGKLLVGDLLKNQLGPELKEKFLQRFNLTMPEIIDRVYRKPFPNRFLASLQPFLEENLHEEAIFFLVMENFSHFIARNVMQYDYQHMPIHFTGSIAYVYRTVLEKAADLTGIQISSITQSPLEGLIRYYGAEI